MGEACERTGSFWLPATPACEVHRDPPRLSLSGIGFCRVAALVRVYQRFRAAHGVTGIGGYLVKLPNPALRK